MLDSIDDYDGEDSNIRLAAQLRDLRAILRPDYYERVRVLEPNGPRSADSSLTVHAAVDNSPVDDLQMWPYNDTGPSQICQAESMIKGRE